MNCRLQTLRLSAPKESPIPFFRGVNGAKTFEGFAIEVNQQLGKVLLDSPARYARQWVFQVTKYRVRGAPVDLDIRNAVVRF